MKGFNRVRDGYGGPECHVIRRDGTKFRYTRVRGDGAARLRADHARYGWRFVYSNADAPCGGRRFQRVRYPGGSITRRNRAGIHTHAEG